MPETTLFPVLVIVLVVCILNAYSLLGFLSLFCLFSAMAHLTSCTLTLFVIWAYKTNCWSFDSLSLSLSNIHCVLNITILIEESWADCQSVWFSFILGCLFQYCHPYKGKKDHWLVSYMYRRKRNSIILFHSTAGFQPWKVPALGRHFRPGIPWIRHSCVHRHPLPQCLHKRSGDHPTRVMWPVLCQGLRHQESLCSMLI